VGLPSSPDPIGALPAERFRRLRELGSCSVPTWAALEALPEGRTRLVVVEQVSRGGAVDDGEIAEWVRVAQRLATLEHPNVARIRDVVVGKDDVVVVSDFVDGVRWAELATGPQPVPIEIALRVFVDALAGLSAIHNLRDAKREPLKLVHGGLTADCVVVGMDGISRIVAASRVRSTMPPDDSASAYLAPEVLLADDAADARADVYSVGVMLWEALSGRPLFPNSKASAILTALLSGRVPRADAPKGAPWAAGLVDVAARALSVEPGKRLASASAMAAEIRRIAGVKLVPAQRVAAFVRAGFGERVQTRREQLERGEVTARGPARVEPQDIPVDFDDTSSATPIPVPTSLTATRPPPPAEEAAGPDRLRVVLSSEPPTRPRASGIDGSTKTPSFPAAMAVPAAPPVPRELVAPTDVPPSLPMPPPPVGAPVPSVFPSEAPPVARRRSRAAVYASVAGAFVVALAGLLTWLGLRGSAQTEGSARMERPPAATAASVETQPPTARTASEVPSIVPSAAAAAEPSAAPTEAASAPSAATTTSATLAPAMPAKPRPAIKYDPQGI